MKASSVLWEGNFPSFVFTWFWLDIQQFELFECNKLQIEKAHLLKKLRKALLKQFWITEKSQKTGGGFCSVGDSAVWMQ